MSSSTGTADSFIDSPWINIITGHIAHWQEQNVFSKQRFDSVRRCFFLTIGFLVLLYCLIHIQILVYWFLKFIFGLIFKLISFIFWLPLKTVRFVIPTTIGYDIIFPLFWLCSIASFSVAKYYHENICQFYDRQIVRRYKILNHNQTNREAIRRYLFIATFIVLLLLQSVFFLLPIAKSIKHHHHPVDAKASSLSKVVKPPVSRSTAKSAVKKVVQTASDSFYNRFVDAFKDENETLGDGKRSPFISDEKLKDTSKTIQKSAQNGIKNSKEEKKQSRFQRWIVHYLKAPFKKWEHSKTELANSNLEKSVSPHDEEEEEEDEEFNSSSSIFDVDDSDDEDDEEDDDDEDTEAHSTITDRIKQRLDTVKHLGERLRDNVKSKISSSMEEDSDDDDDDKSSSVKGRLAKGIEKVKTIGEEVTRKVSSSFTDDNDSEEEEILVTNAEKIKEKLTIPIENLKRTAGTVVRRLKTQLSSSKEIEDDDSEEDISILTETIQQSLVKPVETMSSSTDEEESTSLTEPFEKVKHLGEKLVHNIQNKLSSPQSTDDDDSGVESDNEEVEHSSIIDRVKQNIIETATHHLRTKFASFPEVEEDASLMDRAEQTEEKIVTPALNQITNKADKIPRPASNHVDSTEEFTSDRLDKSSKFPQEKPAQIKTRLPKGDRVLSNAKHQVVESKASRSKKVSTNHIRESIPGALKPVKKPKKGKTELQTLDGGQLPRHGKKKSKQISAKYLKLVRKGTSKSRTKKLNGWFDEGWNVWHLTKTKIFSSSTKHARHVPRYNTTSIYTAYTDIACCDYRKKQNLYRVLKNPHLSFLDSYRHHSPFPVYVSVLTSNGPKCYRHYPDSTCGLISKSSKRNFVAQLYRFVRFWMILGLILTIGAIIYQHLTHGKQNHTSSPPSHGRDSDRSTNRIQSTSALTKHSNSSISTATTHNTSSINPPTSGPLNDQIETQFRLWLQREQNDGFINLSEICRKAINTTFSKQLERMSVETLQFANAKIRNVSQNNNTKNEISADKLIINAVLDIDHLILNIVNTFKEQHFSFETPKLSGQLYVLLIMNPNQYSIEASLKQLRINPVNIIDPNNALLADEKQSIGKLIDETIQRTTVRCSFRLSDNQENINKDVSYSDSTKVYSSLNQPQSLSSSIPIASTRSRPLTPNIYQQSESPPTLFINDQHSDSYRAEQEPKRLLVRVVKAVKLHNVEQPYCILELNHPKQSQQTSIAKNGLNPFWDERFLFECDDKSNQIHLQIIDRKTTNKKMGTSYVDSVYADVSIPFSYVTSIVYKQDVQISPQYPESIIRIEFSTLSEEDALAANNGYDVESLTDSQAWTYSDREANKLEQDYAQRYQQSSSNDFAKSTYDDGTLPKHYGLSTSLYTDERDHASTIPRSIGLHSPTTSFLPSTPRDSGLAVDKPVKSKSFMSSLKHLTLPRRKHRHKDKQTDESMSSQASSISQLNISVPTPATNLAAHSLSSALPGPHPEYFLPITSDSTPIRRSRSISQSFKNLFRSSSKKKGNAARADALGEFENGTHNFLGDNRIFLSTSTPTSKKLSFLHRRKSKQKAKQQTNFSTNSLSSYDYSSHSSIESMRDTPVRANVGHPVVMSKSLVR